MKYKAEWTSKNVSKEVGKTDGKDGVDSLVTCAVGTDLVCLLVRLLFLPAYAWPMAWRHRTGDV